MRNRKLPAYCHHAPTGQAYVRLTVRGRRQTVYLGVHNSRESLEKYDKVVGEWLASKTAPAKQDGLSIADLSQRFNSHHGPKRPHHTEAAMNLLAELFGARGVTDFDALMFERFKSELARRGYARKYANELIGLVKRAFRYAMQRRYIEPGQYTLIESVEPLGSDEAPTKIVEPIDPATVDITLPELPATLAAMVRFIRATGCRPGEARTARIGDIDRQSWLLELKHHKTATKGKLRFIAIPAEVQDQLLPRLLRPADRYVFSPEADGSHPYERRALGRAIDRAIARVNAKRKRAGKEPVAHWHAYQLRHARAVEVRERYGIEVAQVLLGHAKIDMSQHYAALTREKAESLAKLLG